MILAYGLLSVLVLDLLVAVLLLVDVMLFLLSSSLSSLCLIQVLPGLFCRFLRLLLLSKLFLSLSSLLWSLLSVFDRLSKR